MSHKLLYRVRSVLRSSISVRQRLLALFLTGLVALPLIMQPIVVYAITAVPDDSALYKKSAPTLPVAASKNQPDADYARLQASGASIGAGQVAQDGDVLAGPTSPKAKITPHELVGERTATRDVRQNADGTFTERDYMAPKYFKNSNTWQVIDPSLIEDKNAGDAGTIFGQLWGQVESVFKPQTTFIEKANDWKARFAPSDFARGMLRIQQGNEQIGYVPVGANAVDPVTTTDDQGRQTVHYYNLWPNIDVEYQVDTYQVKENVILKNKNAASKVQFKMLGATLTPVDADGQTAFEIRDAFGGQFSIPVPNLILNNFGMETNVKASGLTQSFSSSVLTVALDPAYLKTLPAQAFPVVVDPTHTFTSTLGTRQSGNYVSFKSDGYVCQSTVCNAQAGSLQDSNYVWRSWRGAFYAQYTGLSGKVLLNANLHIVRRTGVSFYTGDSTNHSFRVWRAGCTNGYNCYDGNYPSDAFVMGDVANVDVTNIYQALVYNGNWGSWLFVTGEETTANTYKNFDPDPSVGTYVTFTYNTVPPTPTVVSPQTDNQVYVDPQVSFSVNPVTDADGDPVQYYFRVATGSDGETGTVINSGNLTANQWTVPDGVLQDGTTYYLHTYTFDGYNYSAPSAVRPFRIDMRRGKDQTQTYDTAGPVTVDLATGNLETGNVSHASSALGGSLGISLDYNSPLRSRTGLIGEYYNNDTLSGSPVLSRVDQNINFDWGQGSPGSGVPVDNFSTRWTGYFVAPQTGSYQFASDSDDGCHVWINNQLIIDAWTWHNCAGQYSAVMNFTAGQLVPIEVEQHDAGGGAYAKLYVKGIVSGTGMIVPSTWLQTGVRPIAQQQGLVGHYYNYDSARNLDAATNVPILTRVDPLLSFNWGSGPVVPGTASDFMARWTGYINLPVSGTYNFGTNADDGSRIKIDGNTVMDNWNGACCTLVYGAGVQLSAGMHSIVVDMFDAGAGASMYLYAKGAVTEQIIPSSWLSPQAQVVPNGWSLGIDPDGSLSYDRLTVNKNSAILADSTGYTHEYTWTGTAYKPPVNEDGTLLVNADGTYTLQDVDGRTYVFSLAGVLTSVTVPVDDRHPAALKYSYSGSPAKITQITDGIDSSRYAKVYYSGDAQCGSAPSGFDANAPTGMLCAVQTNDGRATYFYYLSGYLARIVKPGNDTTDYQYDTLGRVVGIRDSLASDAVNAGIRSADGTELTQIDYDNIGRVSGVMLPAAIVGANRQQKTYEYLPAAIDGSYAGATQEHITGATEPNGFTERVEYDNLFRTTKVVDKANLASTSAWDSVKDLLYSTTDPTGMKSTWIYDGFDRATDSYGPAPAAWYGSDRKPLASYVSQVPHSQTNYDESIRGLGIAIFDNKNLTGSPKLHVTGFNNVPYASYSIDLTTGGVTPVNGLAIRATGKVYLAQAGTYSFRLWHSDGARIYVGNTRIINDWVDGAERYSPAGTYNNPTAGQWVDYSVEIYKTGTTGRVFGQLFMTPPSGSEQADISAQLSPAYNLVTSTKMFDAQIGDAVMSTNYGSTPELGLAQNVSVDPGGLNLTASAAYEAPGSGGYLRQTSKTLPGGATATYAYYGSTDTVDNPCTQAVEAYHEGGMLKLRTEPDPGGAGSQTGRTTETIYDDAGRPVASRYNTDPWTCTTYDARGRVAQQSVPDINGRPGRTITTDYAYQGSPLKVQTVDSVAGATISEIDLLGRSVSATDQFGNVSTATYDNLDRLTSKTSPLGTESYTYDSYDRPTTYSVNSTTYATMTYDAYSRVQNITYNQAQDASGNTLKLEQIKRDALQRTIGATYRFSNGLAFDETLTRSQSGIVLSSTDAYNSLSATSSYAYDKAGRLTSATIDKQQYTYDYGAPNAGTCNQSSANLNAQKDSNRTSFTVTDLTTNQVTSSITYCYDQADRLIASSDVQVGMPTYDDHGNTISLAGNGTPVTFGYDASDSNISITQGANQVTYLKTASGSILRKKEYQNGNLTASYRYLASGAVMQTCSLTDDTACTTVDTYIGLPGGLTLTLAPNNQNQALQTVYSLKNFHGDTAMTVGSDGTPTSSVYLYEPFGQSSSSVTFSTNSNPANSSNQSMGWAANPTRKAEGLFTIAIIQMGARVYLPSLGRFLQVDPIEGGTANSYVYVSDPINGNDYTGQFGLGDIFHAVQRATSIITAAVRVISRVVTVAVRMPAKPAAQTAAKTTSTYSGGSSLPLTGGKVDFTRLNYNLYQAHPVTPQKPFDYYSAADAAQNWAGGGALF